MRANEKKELGKERVVGGGSTSTNLRRLKYIRVLEQRTLCVSTLTVRHEGRATHISLSLCFHSHSSKLRIRASCGATRGAQKDKIYALYAPVT